MWLLRYRAKDTTGLEDDDVGVGLVGSVTFCLVSHEMEQRPPEDCYALHAYWEMSCQRLIVETEVEENSTEYNTMLRHCNVTGLNRVSIVRIAEVAPKLQYPGKLVAVANATTKSEAGWVVLDGARSRWYSASEMPTGNSDRSVLMLHVGRVLLGFGKNPDRGKFLKPANSPRTPKQIAAAYEALLDAADHAEPASQKKSFDSFSPLGRSFDAYVDALIALNRRAEVPALIEKFQPHWDHNSGYGDLGAAAFRSGHDDIAERFFRKLRESYKDWCRSENVGFLAEIWHRQERQEDAHTLLVDALKGLQQQSSTATGSDRKLFEKWFQTRRSTYLKLFPERGDAELRRQGIVSSTLMK
jgi:hypothetical protein